MNVARLLLLGSILLALLVACGTDKAVTEIGANVPQTIQVTSSAFDSGGSIPTEYTCEGDDLSPPLSWSQVPEEARSLALIVDDPDAPRGTWVHWVLYDLPPDVVELSAGVPSEANPPVGGSHGENDFGDLGYGGPCPPGGDAHRYFFRLYALNRPLELAPGATAEEVLAAAEGHILARGVLMGTFQR